MEDRTNFLKAISEHPILKSIIEDKEFSKVNFNGLNFKKEFDNWYSFENIKIGQYLFRSMIIIITPSGTSINLKTNDVSFFDTPLIYFNAEGNAHEMEPILEGEIEHKEFRRKLGSFLILNHTMRASVLKSSAYGCTIKLSLL